MKEYALIRGGVVVGVAVAPASPDPRWLSAVQGQYDAVVLLTAALGRPGVGWAYDGQSFAAPAE